MHIWLHRDNKVALYCKSCSLGSVIAGKYIRSSVKRVPDCPASANQNVTYKLTFRAKSLKYGKRVWPTSLKHSSRDEDRGFREKKRKKKKQPSK